MKYIGIRGHRGAGKTAISYLLANTINWLANKKDMEYFQTEFNEWCRQIKENPQAIYNLDLSHVIVEGFGDGPKMMLSMLTGIPIEVMNDDYSKDHLIFNFKDFSYKIEEDLSNIQTVTAEELFHLTTFSMQPEPIKSDIYITLRELILYFGIYIMQNAFGLNVWVKSLVANNKFYCGLFTDDSDGYKIFADIKARTEISYILDKGGVIVKVNRPHNKKYGGMDLLRGDSRYDYEININCEIEELSSQILEVAKKITGYDV